MKKTSELLTKHVSNQFKIKYSSIRLQDVNYYLSKRDDVQVNYKPKTYNSCVSPGAKFDLKLILWIWNQKMLLLIPDMVLLRLIFLTKIAEVVPIKNRTPEAMIDGLKKIFTSMGKPKQLYSDEESSMRSAKMYRLLNENEIKSVQTTTHAHTVERFIRTFKDNWYRRLDSLNEDKTKWITHKYTIIEQNIIQLSIALLK